MIVCFHDHAISLRIGERHTTAGIDVVSVGCAPGREGVGIDVCLDDNFPFSDQSLANLLGLILPLEKGERELVTIDEKGFAAIVVRFLVPSDSNRLNLSHERLGC